MMMFQLHRLVDVSGVSGGGHVADGVEFDDGTCVLRWRTTHSSTAVYASFIDLMTIHSHGGKTVARFIERAPGNSAFFRGATDCIQDEFEGCALASIGGSLASPAPPPWIPSEDADKYMTGYLRKAEELYAPDPDDFAITDTEAS